ncbi:MAG: hypothetical protein V4709_04325 [Pseudomonadota bacterium]
MKLEDSERARLAARAQKQKPSEQRLQLTDKEQKIHFLRGVGSRASIALPAFYLFMGASIREGKCSIAGYPGAVFQHSTEFSSCSTVSLCCRKVFDHARGMTGADFSKVSDQTFAEVADYWANSSGRNVDDAAAALALLKVVFRQCSRSPSELLGHSPILGKRIGLLKQHADRVAAHLSLEHYEFSLLDCAHVVAALTVLGEIVVSFDDKTRGSGYFNDLDKAAYDAAKYLFPNLPEHRLFDGVDIAMQARGYWQLGADNGARLILEELPYATGWF